MTLLDEEPAVLIAECVEHFDSVSDRHSVSRITESLRVLKDFRKQLSTQHVSTLQKLSRQRQTLESQHRHTLDSYDALAHGDEILRLDTEKFKIAKQASDLEIEGERLGAELEGLRVTLHEVDEQGPEGGEAVERELAHPEENETVLKLRIYRDLGMGVEADPLTGKHNRVTFQKTGDIHYLGSDKKMDHLFYCNMFWDKL